MIAEYLRSIDGIEILGIAGLLFSIVLFCAMLFWVLRLRKDRCAAMARLPLEGNPPDTFPGPDA